MNWSEYKDKKGKTADFAKKEKEIGDIKRTYIAMVQKAWNPTTGEKLDDQEREWSLSQLESEKKRYDDEMARSKAQSDGLALAIEDFKKL